MEAPRPHQSASPSPGTRHEEEFLEAALDLLPRCPPDPAFTRRVCARVVALARRAEWRGLWQARIEAVLRNLTRGQWARPAWGILGLALMATGIWWGLSAADGPPRSSEVVSRSGINQEAGNLSVQWPDAEDAEVIEDLDWILANWHNDLWTQENIVALF